MAEINFPNLEDIASNVRVFEGDAPNNANTDSVFARGTLVGLFSSTTPSNGPDYGLTSGGSLTGTAIIDVFEKTSSVNEGIMRLTSLSTDTQVWNSLTSDGSLTGWSIRTILGDYYGFVISDRDPIPITDCLNLVASVEGPNGRLLVGPTGVNDSYLLYKCDDISLTGSTASIGEVFVVVKPESTGSFQTYECITPGSGTNDPATFTGPIEGAEGSYFTSYTPLTGGAECGYPYIWNWGDKLQDWKYDCGASGWIGEGSTITTGPVGGQGSQGFQGFIGNDAPTTSRGPQGFQGFQGTQGFQGNIGRQGRQGFQGFLGGTGTVNVAGNDGEIQYKQGTGLSANSLAKIVSDPNLDPNSGYSGNFANYSESIRIDTGTYSSGGTINIDFDAYNIYRALNVNITNPFPSPGVDPILTIQGFDSHTTGQSMTLILAYEGTDSNGRIQIPANQDIYWAGGPLDEIGEGGQTTNIVIDTTQKKYAVFNFFSDGERVYGSRSINYRKED